jgi:hypothetical protein
MPETALEVIDSEQQKRWTEMAEIIKRSAETRRRQRTSPSKQKVKKDKNGNVLKDNSGKPIVYVDRPDYQIWLDNNFPGWTTEDFHKPWIEKVRSKEGDEVPFLFCIAFTLVVIDSGMAKRRIPCVGCAPVAQSELDRTNSTLMVNKFPTALSNAYKQGCNWLDAFFDLRADDEERENSSKPASDEQLKRFTDLLTKIPSTYKDETTKAWNKMTRTSADKFLDGLQEKIDNLAKLKI